MQLLKEEAEQILSSVVYHKFAKKEQAPRLANCVTIISYLFKKILQVDIPYVWIGNMPRALSNLSSWRVIRVDSSQIKCGDLLFVKKVDRTRLLSHVAVAIDDERVFHASAESGKASIQSIKEFFSEYEQTLSFSEMIRYLDYRSRENEDDIYLNGGE